MGSIPIPATNVLVAERLERLTVNQKYLGSNPNKYANALVVQRIEYMTSNLAI